MTEHLVLLDGSTVTLDALQRAAYAVADRMSVDLRQQGQDWRCMLLSRPPAAADVAELEHVWRAEVNDQVLRLRISSETEHLRNLVFAVAFSRTGLVENSSPS